MADFSSYFYAESRLGSIKSQFWNSLRENEFHERSTEAAAKQMKNCY